MEVLFTLIHALAKEEKRLYNLHGRKGRFTAIYEAYAGAKHYSRDLDKEIYEKEFSSLTRAFYSMQKKELYEDLLAVLLEYSNPASPLFRISRSRAKAEVLKHKGFFDASYELYKEGLEAANETGIAEIRATLMAELLAIYPETENASWQEYKSLADEYENLRNSLPSGRDRMQDLKVLIRTVRANPALTESLRPEAEAILQEIDTEAEAKESWLRVFAAQKAFGESFEDPLSCHKRLIALEKRFNLDKFPSLLRMQVIVTLVESAMNVGDFLLMNALIYKTRNLVRSFPAEEKQAYLPRYLELSGTYHFYENELSTASEEFREILGFHGLDDSVRIMAFMHLASSEHAANLSRQARATMTRLLQEYPRMNEAISYRLLELMISAELDDREMALSTCQKLRSFLRKQPNARALLPYRTFVEQVKKYLEKKSIKIQPVPGLDPGWEDLYRPGLWLKAKVEGSFYYNYLLDYWQARKKVLKV